MTESDRRPQKIPRNVTSGVYTTGTGGSTPLNRGAINGRIRALLLRNYDSKQNRSNVILRSRSGRRTGADIQKDKLRMGLHLSHGNIRKRKEMRMDLHSSHGIRNTRLTGELTC